MMRENQKKIDEVKNSLSNGKSRFENGKTIVEVGLSDLNKLLDMTYEYEKISSIQKSDLQGKHEVLVKSIELLEKEEIERGKLRDIIQGFLIWEEMFPSVKQISDNPLLKNDDFEDYQKLLAEAKAMLH